MADGACVRPQTRQSQWLGRTEGCPLASPGGPTLGAPLPSAGSQGLSLVSSLPLAPGSRGVCPQLLCLSCKVLCGLHPPQGGLFKSPRETSHMCIHCEPPAFTVSALVVEGCVVTALACALRPLGCVHLAGRGVWPMPSSDVFRVTCVRSYHPSLGLNFEIWRLYANMCGGL